MGGFDRDRRRRPHLDVWRYLIPAVLGQGFCYNMGRGLGALIPALVRWLSATMPLGQAIGLFALGSYGLLVVAALLLPETRGKLLEA